MVVFCLDFLKLFLLEYFEIVFFCFFSSFEDEIKWKVVASYISNPTLFLASSRVQDLSLDEHSNFDL